MRCDGCHGQTEHVVTLQGKRYCRGCFAQHLRTIDISRVTDRHELEHIERYIDNELTLQRAERFERLHDLVLSSRVTGRADGNFTRRTLAGSRKKPKEAVTRKRRKEAKQEERGKVRTTRKEKTQRRIAEPRLNIKKEPVFTLTESGEEKTKKKRFKKETIYFDGLEVEV